jgi:hypothetical protein
MKKVSLFKKIKLYFEFRKVLIKNKAELEEKFSARIDSVSRVYTVLNIPTNLIDEPYNVRKQDIDNLSKQFIREYSQEISKYLDSVGAVELYDFYQVEKVDKYSYLIVFGFSLFNTDKLARKLFFRYLPISIITLIILSILFFI